MNEETASRVFRLSEAELTEINDAFAVFDTDRSGEITSKEARIALRALGYDNTKQEFVQLMKDMEADRGVMTYTKFLKTMTKFLAEKHAKEEISYLFQMILNHGKSANRGVSPSRTMRLNSIIPNRKPSVLTIDLKQHMDVQAVLQGVPVSALDTRITEDHLRKTAASLGERLSDEDIKDMMEEADRDNDGMITEDDFVRVMLKTTLW